jgi:hypothetical protein
MMGCLTGRFLGFSRLAVRLMRIQKRLGAAGQVHWWI